MNVPLKDCWSDITAELSSVQMSEETWRLMVPYLSFATIRWFGRAAKLGAQHRRANPIQTEDVHLVLRIVDFPLDINKPESHRFGDTDLLARVLRGEPNRVISERDEVAEEAYKWLGLITGRAIDLVLTTANQEAVREGQGNHGIRIIEARHVFKHCDRLPYPLSLWLC